MTGVNYVLEIITVGPWRAEMFGIDDIKSRESQGGIFTVVVMEGIKATRKTMSVWQTELVQREK